jgi:putative flippase GtrA
MVKTTAVDMREFGRFVLTGVTATIGNLSAVWLARKMVAFEIACWPESLLVSRHSSCRNYLH